MEKYEVLEIEVITFTDEDVITSSVIETPEAPVNS